MKFNDFSHDMKIKRAQVICITLAALCLSHVNAGENITIDNWRGNENLSDVRLVYKESQSEKFKENKKIYNINSSACSVYPIKEKLVRVDKTGKVRKLSIIQIISHGELLLSERFYDEKGIIRFVFIKSALSETRIYLNQKGLVIWAVNKDDNVYTKAEYSKDDWETLPATSTKAAVQYNELEKCSLIK